MPEKRLIAAAVGASIVQVRVVTNFSLVHITDSIFKLEAHALPSTGGGCSPTLLGEGKSKWLLVNIHGQGAIWDDEKQVLYHIDIVTGLNNETL